jgi:hypothetical protein
MRIECIPPAPRWWQVRRRRAMRRSTDLDRTAAILAVRLGDNLSAQIVGRVADISEIHLAHAHGIIAQAERIGREAARAEIRGALIADVLAALGEAELVERAREVATMWIGVKALPGSVELGPLDAPLARLREALEVLEEKL